jgi:hypothetical protein
MPEKTTTQEKRDNPVFFENWNEPLIAEMPLALFEEKVKHFGSLPSHRFPDDITKEEIKEAHEHIKAAVKKKKEEKAKKEAAAKKRKE